MSDHSPRISRAGALGLLLLALLISGLNASAAEKANNKKKTSVTPAPEAPLRAEVRANPGAEKKILIVTGCDMHKWKLTTPVLVKALAEDKRLEVSVTENVNFMGRPELKNYDAIVLHYMNWQAPSPEPDVLENFRKTVEGGAGLVLVHFACGAFQGWPEFVKMAGRAWNPKFRPHDPRGAFRVEITDKRHPVAAPLEAFETTDELYTCLDGAEPVTVHATARSKVDGKDYPMAFSLTYGKGRVYHSVLGHDVQALDIPPVQQLYRRSAAWAAGLNP